MKLRSLLFVPGDRPERFVKAANSGADALIFDLEDSVTLGNKERARDAVAAYLKGAGGSPLLMVRINPLDSAMIEGDLASLARSMPAAIMLPKAEGAAAIRRLDGSLSRHGLTGVPVLPIATETPAALFELGSLREVANRLIGVTWGAEDLPLAIGAATARESDGRYTAPIELARSLALFAAHAAGVAAIDTVYPAFRDIAGLTAYAARAARDGYSGMLAIHPDQVAAINTAFTPGPVEIAQAQRVVAAFARARGAGALQLDGAMIDAPHLKRAVSLLARARGEDDRPC